ncbi:serine/threonine-protein kinase [Streptomyces sp. NPDC056544]|uniref:serine/threonine-protein kinase n=1 Tax=unclassified Streptomyces TaxID=2593676 RepID=UPI0036B5EECF
MDGTQRMIADRYRLIHPIAEGGFGRVWKAHDEVLRADVVVKEVLLPFAADPDEQARRLMYAEREARNAARLRHHAGIVPVYDVVTADGRPWIVMELIDGSSLEERLNTQGPLSMTKTAEIADTLLKALDAAHGADVVHRDVKPANVMLAADGRILLTDFGIATYQVDTRLTTDGSVIGSLEYIAPERLNGVIGTPASDLFSLGVTLYRTVEGVSPFLRDSPTATLAAVLREDPPPLRRAGRLTALIQALLAKDPDARPTVAEARALLRAPRTPKASIPKTSTPKTSTPKKDRPAQSRKKTPTVTPPHPGEIFEQSWTGGEDPRQFSEYKGPRDEAFIGYGFAAMWLAVGLLQDWDDYPNLGEGGGIGVCLVLALASVSFLEFRERRRRRWLREWLDSRVLRVDQEGITTRDSYGDQRIPWTRIAQLSVHRTEGKAYEHSLLALHLQLHAPKSADSPPLLYHPAGWHRGVDPVDPGDGNWVPVCVLGPLPEPRRVALKIAVGAFPEQPVKAEWNW